MNSVGEATVTITSETRMYHDAWLQHIERESSSLSVDYRQATASASSQCIRRNPLFDRRRGQTLRLCYNSICQWLRKPNSVTDAIVARHLNIKHAV